MDELKNTRFHKHLTLSNTKIRDSRAQGVTVALHRRYKRLIEDKEYKLDNITRELDDMLDLHPETAIGLTPGKDFDDEAFVRERSRMLVQQRMLEVELQVIKLDFRLLFSAAPTDGSDPLGSGGSNVPTPGGDPIDDPATLLDADLEPNTTEPVNA